MEVESLSVCSAVKASLEARSNIFSYDGFSDKGANGYVVFGTNIVSGQRVAIKYYYWGGERQHHAEPRHLAAVRNEHVVEILHADLVDTEWAQFITPFCPGGDLDDLISGAGLSLHRSIDLAMNILDGVSALHSNQLVHRDIKPANILLDAGGRALIGDFGSVRRLSTGVSHVPASGHSILYRPPESCCNRTYSRQGDIYQVGVVLYQLLGGCLPYDEVSWLSGPEKKHYWTLHDRVEKTIFADKVLAKRIQKNHLLDLATLSPWVPDCLRRIVRKATKADPEQRYGNASQFMADLHNAKGRCHDWEKDDGVICVRSRGRDVRIAINDAGMITAEQNKGHGWRRIALIEPNMSIVKTIETVECWMAE